MPIDPEATSPAWNDAIHRHDIDECLSLMSDDYKHYSDPSWEYPMARNDWGGFLKSFCAVFPDWR
ncbi:nuclear transport factor 2 family protein [Mycobacterium sp. DL440]|uniref:nuclear transport factor 2 family protein n=1 Tax=Mycobacterium sp. DL440 TaxID=2675523 RepID=UPI0014200E42|nr:nuclear transport factor 2 family protein [Mycobacterium sp. DL440]